MIGKVAKCKRGVIGIIIEKTINGSPNYSKHKILYKGITLDGKPWQSNDPIIVANSIREYVQNNVDEFLPLMAPSEAAK